MKLIDVEDLIALVHNYNPRANADLIRRAYDYGMAMHEGQLWIKGLDHFAGGHVGSAKGGKQIDVIAKAQHLRGRPHGLIRGFFAVMLEGGAGKLLAQAHKTAAVFFAQGPANRGFGPTGRDNVDPRGLRLLTFGGDNFDRLTVLETGPKRHADAIDLGRNT